MEEDEGSGAEEITGVRRMANAFDSRGYASDASGDDDPSPEKLKAQWTGGSAGSEGWRRWQVKRKDVSGGMRNKREPTSSSRGMTYATSSSRGMTYATSSPAWKDIQLRESSPDSELGTPMDEEPAMYGQLAPPMDHGAQGLKRTDSIDDALDDPSIECHPLDRLESIDRQRGTPPLLDRFESRSMTPTPDRLSFPYASIPDTPLDTPSKTDASVSPHMSSMLHQRTAGANPYGALRRSSASGTSTGPRLPSLPSVRSILGLDDESGTGQSSRRITIRPDPLLGTLHAKSPPGTMTEREKQMEIHVASLLDRIKDLESRLESVSRPASPVTPVMSLFPDVFLDKLGLRSKGEDGLPRTIKELPAYLFLVGVGVGAVIVRVLAGRAR